MKPLVQEWWIVHKDHVFFIHVIERIIKHQNTIVEMEKKLTFKN